MKLPELNLSSRICRVTQDAVVSWFLGCFVAAPMAETLGRSMERLCRAELNGARPNSSVQRMPPTAPRLVFDLGSSFIHSRRNHGSYRLGDPVEIDITGFQNVSAREEISEVSPLYCLSVLA